MRWVLILWLGLLTVSLSALGLEPCLAGNKFEIISSGVGGVHALKRDHLEIILFAISGILFLSALLAIFVPHNNSLFMNFANWRQSAMVLGIASTLIFLAAALL
jgi:hypothetical protein